MSKVQKNISSFITEILTSNVSNKILTEAGIYKRTEFYNAVISAGITADSLLNFNDNLKTIQQYAEIIAPIIETFRTQYNIKSDLIGEDLVKNLTESIVRLKLYYYYAFSIFSAQLGDERQTKLNLNVLNAGLKNPNLSQIKTIKEIFNYIPEEFKQIALSKNDLLTNILTGVNESRVLATILSLFEDSETFTLDTSANETILELLQKEAFKIFLKTYLHASIADLPKIDETIYFNFSNPYHLNTRLTDLKLAAAGYTKKEVDPETGKTIKVLDPQKARILHEPISGSDEGTIVNDLESSLMDPTVTPEAENPDALENIEYKPKSEKEARDKEVIFSHDNLLLKYFNTPNYASIVAELLSRLAVNPGYKITYFDQKSLKIVTEPFLKILFEDTDNYSEDTTIPASILSFDTMSNTAEILVTITGEPVEISPQVISQVKEVLKKVAQEHSTPWFNLASLPGRYKEEIRQYFKIEVPSFDVTSKISGNTLKDVLIDLVEKAKLTADSEAKVRDLTLILNQMYNTIDEFKLESLAKLAGIKSNTIGNAKKILTTSATEPTSTTEVPQTSKISSAEEKKLAKKLGDILFDKFAKFIPNSTTKAFEYNGRSYSTRPELTAFVSSLSGEDLTKLWNEIKNGDIRMNDRNNSLFLSQTGASGQASITGFINTIKSLLDLKGVKLTESVILEDVSNVNDVLEDTYAEIFTREATPIIQNTLLELKKLSSFLIALIRLFTAYNNYLARGEKAKKVATSLTNEELDEIEDLQDFFVSGPNKKFFSADTLLDQLRNTRVDSLAIENIVNAFEANKKNPMLTNPMNDPTMKSALDKFRTWLLDEMPPELANELDHAFKKAEVTGNNTKLRELLHTHKNEIEAQLKLSGFAGEGGTLSKSKMLHELIRGTYGVGTTKKETPEVPGVSTDALSSFTF